jgi:hypothetical protein
VHEGGVKGEDSHEKQDEYKKGAVKQEKRYRGMQEKAVEIKKGGMSGSKKERTTNKEQDKGSISRVEHERAKDMLTGLCLLSICA